MINNPIPIRNTIYFLVLMIARNVLGPMDVCSFNTKNHKKQNRDIHMCLVYQGENGAWSSGDFLSSSTSLSRVLRGYVCFQWFGRCLPDGSKLNILLGKWDISIRTFQRWMSLQTNKTMSPPTQLRQLEQAPRATFFVLLGMCGNSRHSSRTLNSWRP